jgi:hypothetical protein
VRNVKRARAAGHRVVIVLQDRNRVPRTTALLQGTFPGLGLWTDGVGLVHKERRAAFRPHRVPSILVWPFLGGAGTVGTEEAVRPPIPVVVIDPLVAHLRVAVRGLVSSGKVEATSTELLSSLPLSERDRYSEARVGRALKVLGVGSRRMKESGTRYRVYELLSRDPVGRPALENGATAEASGQANRAPNPPRENN